MGKPETEEERVARHRRAARCMELIKDLVALDVTHAICAEMVRWVQTAVCPHVESIPEHGALQKCCTCGLLHWEGGSSGIQA